MFSKYTNKTRLKVSIGDGKYKLIIKAWDLANNYAHSAITNFIIDTSPPTIVIISPSENITLTQPANITFTFMSSEKLKWLTLMINGEKYNATLINGTWIVNVTNLEVGTYKWRIQAIDLAGNKFLSKEYEISIISKPTPPILQYYPWIIATIVVIIIVIIGIITFYRKYYFYKKLEETI